MEYLHVTPHISSGQSSMAAQEDTTPDSWGLERASDLGTVPADQAYEICQLRVQIAKLLPKTTPVAQEIRVRVSGYYDGGQSKSEDFLDHMEVCFRFHKGIFSNDEKKIQATVLHLEDRAAEWIRPVVEDYLGAQSDLSKCRHKNKRIFASWEAFKEELRVFGATNEENPVVGQNQPPMQIELESKGSQCTDHSSQTDCPTQSDSFKS